MGLSSRQCPSNVPNIVLLFKILVLLLSLLGASSLHTRQQQQQPSTCLGEERAALLHFNQSFIIHPSASGNDDCYPKVSSWKVAEGDQIGNCCSWDGVECDEKTGHVIGLDLSRSCLYGSINSSSSLFLLVHLRRLNLADNNFNYSRIPETIRNLPRLRYLNLSSSVFSGQVPFQVSELSKLSSLDLSGNVDTLSNQGLLKLKESNLAVLVQNITNLKKLHLSDINISSTLPASISNLSFLTSLFLDNCDLYGEFPMRIFQLQYLEFLNVSSNRKLSGYLPNFNGSSPLSALFLDATNFSRTLPSSIGNLEKLTQLDVTVCSFSGPIPSSLANLTQLTYLSLATNNFVAGPLSWLGKQNKLTHLDLIQINLRGRIPSSLGNLTQLTYLNLRINRLSGQIPSLFGNLSRLRVLDLGENSLSGSIPEPLFDLKDIYSLLLDENNLYGNFDICKLQSSIEEFSISWNKLEVSQCKMMNRTRLPKIKWLGLGGCNISEFPDYVRHQQNLTSLRLSRNNLHGQIPKWMWNTSTQTLEGLDLSSNFLSGLGQPNVVLPWVNLQVLYLDSEAISNSLLHNFSKMGSKS